MLKSLDIPSVLVETGFLTNPSEAKKLKTRAYQKKMAQSIFKGLRSWLLSNPPPNTFVAKWQQNGIDSSQLDRYVIRRGDTLSGIADRFDISLSSLKRANKIAVIDNIRIGQVLIIPNG